MLGHRKYRKLRGLCLNRKKDARRLEKGFKLGLDVGRGTYRSREMEDGTMKVERDRSDDCTPHCNGRGRSSSLGSSQIGKTSKLSDCGASKMKKSKPILFNRIDKQCHSNREEDEMSPSSLRRTCIELRSSNLCSAEPASDSECAKPSGSQDGHWRQDGDI